MILTAKAKHKLLKFQIRKLFGSIQRYADLKDENIGKISGTISGNNPSWQMIDMLCEDFGFTYNDFPRLPDRRVFNVEGGLPVIPQSIKFNSREKESHIDILI